ncbi:NB-ARC domain-containing protein [Wolbachia endosymbiont of Oryzaephilus surinamensis]|uniref:NB-ARC domain-containing protein n=1 Tax=Wolbachia endosymbiont of Oryzaephilus surinamensis TaxID=573241 RepID=UPI0021D5299A|nr:NB-ARC domain-containing protein [Wolbachia endosymbiont of Oryzaephilus surinamensis]UXX40479.1 NB-ARC domain-containing protein [Wolbachia endosymbiont of Oryzaephilus surinamensis]
MLKTYHLKEGVNLEANERLEETEQAQTTSKVNKGKSSPIEDHFSDQRYLYERKHEGLKRLPNLKQKNQVDERLREFTEYFVDEFEAKLNWYRIVLEEIDKKPGTLADVIKSIITVSGAGVVGGTVGVVGSLVLGMPVPAVASATAGAGATGAGKLGEVVGNKVGAGKHKGKAASLSDLVYHFKRKANQPEVRKILIEASFDIFQSFEIQFMKATVEKGKETRAMMKLAKDAVYRVINHCAQKEEQAKDLTLELITKGLVLGESKGGTVSKFVPQILQKILKKAPKPGRTVKDKLSKEEWNTAELYSRVGLAVKNLDDYVKPYNYYRKKEGLTEPDKYGYRRLFASENWDVLKEQYKIDSDIEKSIQFTYSEYEYKLHPESLEQKSKYIEDILKDLNQRDPNGMEDRIKETCKEVKGEIITEFKEIKANIQNFDEIERVIENLEGKVLGSIVEGQEENRKYFEEAERERQKIAKSIEASREESRENFNQLSQKQDIHHDDNKREHKKTQEGIDELKVGQGAIRDEIEALPAKIAGVSYQQVKDREPVWFGVEDLVKSFIALTPGRQDTLDRIADDIKQGIVVISGLRGVGKTELAIKFARGKYSENAQGSAILIDAKDAENSFRILAKDKLKISCKDIDGGEKTINSMVDDVYDYFSNKRSLFIFDNAQRYIDIKKFLPLRLPPGASKPLVLITSDNLNKLEWPSSKVKIEELDKFQESESIKFIKTSLGVSDDSQGKSIKDLANKLYHFPLLLEYAVRDIKRYQEGNQNFKIGDYNSIIDEYIERLNLGLTPHNDVLAELLRIRLDQIRQEEYGERALKIAHVMAYCASQNLPKGIFSDSDDEIGLLQQYSILKQGRWYE